MLHKLKKYLLIMLQLHSKAPTKEIKRNWLIFAIGGVPVVLLTLFCGEKIFFFFSLPKIYYINNYGSWIFFIFIIIYIFIFFDYKKCSEITALERQKYDKT